MTDSPQQQPTPQGTPSDTRPHRPADDREIVYYEGSPLLRGDLGKLFGAAVMAAICVAAAIYFYFWKPGVLPPWAYAAMVVVAILAMVVPLVLVRTTRYRITNYRVDYERGILSKRIDTLELWHVEDIQFRQSLLDRIFNVGTVTVISHDDTTPQLRMDGLPNPRPLFESLKQRVIAVKRQRGVVKMDVG